MTKDEVFRILSKLGFQLGVSPNLIINRLLDDHDLGNAMAAGIDISSLRASIAVWRDNGFCDYAHGKTEPMQTPLM